MTHAGPSAQPPAQSAGYTPIVPAEHAEWIRLWHDRIYQSVQAEPATDQTFSYLGTTLVVPTDVQPIVGVSHLLGEAVLVEVREGDRVLDMGTGSGVNAILAASKATTVWRWTSTHTRSRPHSATPNATASRIGSRSATATSSATSMVSST